MADPVTWPIAFSIVGGIAVTAVTVMGFVIQFFKGDSKINTVINKMDIRLTKVETDLKSLPDKIISVKRRADDRDSHFEKDIGKLESKLEKITDLMIKLLTSQSSDTSKGDFL